GRKRAPKLRAADRIITGLGSIARLVMRFGWVEVHADHLEQSVQRAPFPGRGDSGVHLLAPTLSPGYEHVAELLAERGVDVDPIASGAGCRLTHPSSTNAGAHI